MNKLWITALLLLSLGCRTRDVRSADLGELSATAHEEAATAEMMEAQAHIDAASLYPDEGRGCHEVGLVYFPCWSQMANMVEYNLWEAKQHERRAKEHTAIAVMLRGAENRACQTVSVENKEISPFYHKDDISAVRPAYSSKNSLVGADVIFLPVRGMTRDNLAQIIECQMARNAVLGYDESWMPSCPLMLKEITATVEESAEGFVVHLRAKDPAVAQELSERVMGIPTQE